MHFISVTSNAHAVTVNVDRVLYIRETTTGSRLHFGGDDVLDIDGSLDAITRTLRLAAGQDPTS